MLYGLPEVPTNKGKKGFEANSLELQSPSATLCLPPSDWVRVSGISPIGLRTHARQDAV